MFTGLFAKFVAIPLVGKIIGWGKNTVTKVKGNHRLLIEYFLIAVVLVTAGLALTMWLQREKYEDRLAVAELNLATARQRLTAVEQVNQGQAQTIASLRHLRELDSRALGGLVSDYAKLTARDATLSREISVLEKNNAEVRSYLDEPVPADLARLLEQR